MGEDLTRRLCTSGARYEMRGDAGAGVGGFTDPRGSRVGLGALLVGYYDGIEVSGVGPHSAQRSRHGHRKEPLGEADTWRGLASEEQPILGVKPLQTVRARFPVLDAPHVRAVGLENEDGLWGADRYRVEQRGDRPSRDEPQLGRTSTREARRPVRQRLRRTSGFISLERQRGVRYRSPNTGDFFFRQQRR